MTDYSENIGVWPRRWTCCICQHDIGDVSGSGKPHQPLTTMVPVKMKCPSCKAEILCTLDFVPRFATTASQRSS